MPAGRPSWCCGRRAPGAEATRCALLLQPPRPSRDMKRRWPPSRQRLGSAGARPPASGSFQAARGPPGPEGSEIRRVDPTEGRPGPPPEARGGRWGEGVSGGEGDVGVERSWRVRGGESEALQWDGRVRLTRASPAGAGCSSARTRLPSTLHAGRRPVCVECRAACWCSAASRPQVARGLQQVQRVMAHCRETPTACACPPERAPPAAPCWTWTSTRPSPRCRAAARSTRSSSSA